MKLIDEYIKTLEKELKNKPKISTEETGIVSQVKDGVVILEGLDRVTYGELIEFKKNVLGYVIDLTEDEVENVAAAICDFFDRSARSPANISAKT